MLSLQLCSGSTYELLQPHRHPSHAPLHQHMAPAVRCSSCARPWLWGPQLGMPPAVYRPAMTRSSCPWLQLCRTRAVCPCSAHPGRAAPRSARCDVQRCRASADGALRLCGHRARAGWELCRCAAAVHRQGTGTRRAPTAGPAASSDPLLQVKCLLQYIDMFICICIYIYIHI